ncbi:putative intracellular protease, PfpI family protein [Sulfitobacter noctilucicola]|uniref:Protease I n=1 Tax=Sulfitobacter noctilucicola TaxID=1342301 RepID=A0A7W6M6D3_9RHOB|nr:type 1 glutamine amidotransferase domain-containing protein [Sulfitobacter noctilucicola]KIN62956.1 putative intracellular protease, PfpI family protein [Sulfitobacter noctilucicola]MBB4172517.1 protease I [Sulfitobacter noctilucicola]
MTSITNAKILILSTNGFEQSELEKPLADLKAKGAAVHVATPDGSDIKGWDTDDWGDTVSADIALKDVNVDDYDAIVLPGGQINPDILRANKDAVALIKAFGNGGKTVAAVCHAPWLLIEADLIKGRKATSYGSIKTDLINAGAHWEDSEVVVDQGIITSRSPEDLDAFVSKIVEEIEEGEHERKAA